METIELPLGRYVLRLDGTVLECFDRTWGQPQRLHVNHVAARFRPRRDGTTRMMIGYPKHYIYGGTAPGPGADLVFDDLQPNAQTQVDLTPELESAVRALLVEAARRRTLPLPGSPME